MMFLSSEIRYFRTHEILELSHTTIRKNNVLKTPSVFFFFFFFFLPLPFKYQQLPKQVVAPYKPQDDFPSLTSNGNAQHVEVPLTPSPGPASPMCGPPSAFSINSASSDVSDRAPLLARMGDRGRAGPAAGKQPSIVLF